MYEFILDKVFIMKAAKESKEVELFNSNPLLGLSSEQVKKRNDDGLVNKMPKTVTKTYFKIFLDNVFNFFNIIIFAISIYMIIVGAGPTKLVSLYLLIINIAIGLFQDIKARRKVDKLKVVSYPSAKVIRDGKETEIPANEIVLSDIVVYKLGDQIVADGEVVEGNVEVNESLLTGESLNVHKSYGDKLFSGSYVTSGTAKIRVTKVGKDNYAASLQRKAKKFKRPKSEILISIKKIFLIVGIFVALLGIMMLVTYILQGKFKSELYQDTAISFASSIFAMIPIGMYLLTSLTLAVGVIRLAKKKMLVQELYCIEMLARVDTLCLDKTGTITDGTMSVKDIISLSKENKNEIENILITLIESTKDENTTANALRNAFKGKEILPFTKGLAFSSARKYSATMLSDGRCYVLGAREFLEHDNKIDSKFEEYERQGYRVLLLGYSSKGLDEESFKPKISPVAIIILEEHIKEDAYENINWFKNNGVQIKIISGDNPISVSEIAIRVGVTGAEDYISLEGMSLEEVKEIANKYTVFGRVSPEQKEALVSAMQDAKHVVAMTGDGVNDILALKTADCSIAMASGSDAAKAVSHLVSMDSNFSSLPSVVAEGRRVINNLQRSCSIFLVKTIFAILMSFTFLLVSWFGIKGDTRYPFETNNMYIWELLTIGLASFFLSLQPNEERIENKFFDNIITMSLPGGMIQFITSLILFCISWCNPAFLPFETATSIAVITFSIISLYTLLIICWPYDIYRKVLVVATSILIFLFFIIDYFAIYNPALGHESFFAIEYNSINNENWYVLLLSALLPIPSYIGLTFLAQFVQNKIVLKRKLKNENQ